LSRAGATAGYKVGTTGHRNASGEAPAGNSALVNFLQLLSRAARQSRTYPATSPLSVDAIMACHHAFSAIGGEPLTFRVSARDLIVDDARIGRDSIIEHELARPLHRARVVSVEIDHTASPRDWSHFCAVLNGCHRPTKAKTTVAELLLDAGVGAIVVRTAPRPEMVELGVPAAAVRHLLERERAHQSPRAGGPVQYFYPPDKGWVRFDPSVPYDSVSLLDLAVLVNEPTELAAILMRLTDDGGDDGVKPEAALEQKYGDVVTLISALDPRLAQLLFSKLARAVLALDSSRRQTLLRRSILPGLLDGRADSEAVLTEFPDVDLAEALVLLLDLETATPGLLPTAVDRLHLPSQRRATVIPFVRERLKAGPSVSGTDRRIDADLSRYAEALIRMDSASSRNFADFADFDLSMNDETSSILADIRRSIETTDSCDARLSCLSNLTRLEPNPVVVGAFVERSLEALREVVRAGQWPQLVHWLARFVEIASALQESRPEVADAVRQVSDRLCDQGLVLRLGDLCGGGEQERAHVDAIVATLGRSLVPAWLEGLGSPASRTRIAPLVPVLSAHARALAPAVARSLPNCGTEALRGAIAFLGSAGAGYEGAIAEQLQRCDERGGREALHALARIGTSRAARVVVEQIENGSAWAPGAAEDALWRLPPALALAKVRELLERRRFVVRRPELAARLLARAAHGKIEGLKPVLEGLVSLRYHFWSPAIVRVGAKARELLQ
jgi:hypothetical protein